MNCLEIVGGCLFSRGYYMITVGNWRDLPASGPSLIVRARGFGAFVEGHR